MPASSYNPEGRLVFSVEPGTAVRGSAAIFLMPDVLAPLLEIRVHVVNSPSIGWITVERSWLLLLGKWPVRHFKLTNQVLLVCNVAESRTGRRSGPASVLPFGLARQPNNSSLPFAQHVAKIL